MNRIRASVLAIAAALLVPGILASGAAKAQFSISISIAPPVLPVYDQPPLPAAGYIWVPGYWAYGDFGYYWVPGTWIAPPQPEFLWTPGYWGWGEGVYIWHAGYWGPHIGFYGGVNYGFGYAGSGYQGGYWDHGHFNYNRTVNNFGSTHITNVYNRTVVINNVTNVSYNGGTGGVRARPSEAEVAAVHERHIAATPTQQQHIHAASTNHALLASVNHGRPAIAATSRPGAFTGNGVVHARAGGQNAAAPHAFNESGEVHHSGGAPDHSARGGPVQHHQSSPSHQPARLSQTHENAHPHKTAPVQAPKPQSNYAEMHHAAAQHFQAQHNQEHQYQERARPAPQRSEPHEHHEGGTPQHHEEHHG